MNQYSLKITSGSFLASMPKITEQFQKSLREKFIVLGSLLQWRWQWASIGHFVFLFSQATIGKNIKKNIQKLTFVNYFGFFAPSPYPLFGQEKLVTDKQEHKVSYRCSLPSPLQKRSKDYKGLHWRHNPEELSAPYEPMLFEDLRRPPWPKKHDLKPEREYHEVRWEPEEIFEEHGFMWDCKP